ncbi:5-formyltetrahydrofolate cyclo-ligase [Psychrilyobacter atlanticus]|uniref:5-formyltetrahydrofolate cyclo-ligase n=1 Tax=Psychrilyobacter atlanticus TaxID=271091 RepID=UPI0003F7646D|nr:5-formyltetrahydrofolate cyclo-ligase [Psychrilyobacter atlanticus]
MSNYKKSVRKTIISQRDLLKLNDIKEKSNKIINKLYNTSNFIKANTIFIFVSFGSEVDTREAIKYMLSLGKTVCVPKVMGKLDMRAIKISTIEDLAINKMGILEPRCGVEIDSTIIDMVVVPGVAFDKKGYRIGYGGGFYDIFMSKLQGHTSKVGIAFDLQVIEDISYDSFDMKIDSLLTETAHFIF